MKIGHAEHFRWLEGVLGAIIVFNLADACLTLLWCSSGSATEANPLMATLLGFGPVHFVLGKVALVSGGVHLLWNARQRALSVVAVFVIFLAYYYVLLYHLHGLKTHVTG